MNRQSILARRAAAVQLYCLPCAGSSATMYWRWRRSFAGGLEVSPIELPGRGHLIAQEHERDFARLIERLCDGLTLRKPGSYALFGHSMGALIAYGVTSALQRRGAALPSALIVSGCPAPAIADAQRFAAYQSDLSLIEHLREYGGTDSAVFGDLDLLRFALDTLRADYQLLSTFRYAGNQNLPVPIYVFAGRQDHIDEAQLTPWMRETTMHCELHWFDGGHFFIQQREDAVLTTLTALLNSDSRNRPHASTVSA